MRRMILAMTTILLLVFLAGCQASMPALGGLFGDGQDDKAGTDTGGCREAVAGNDCFATTKTTFDSPRLVDDLDGYRDRYRDPGFWEKGCEHGLSASFAVGMPTTLARELYRKGLLFTLPGDHKGVFYSLGAEGKTDGKVTVAPAMRYSLGVSDGKVTMCVISRGILVRDDDGTRFAWANGNVEAVLRDGKVAWVSPMGDAMNFLQ